MENPTNSNPPADTGVPPQATGSTIVWDADGLWLRGYLPDDPKTTLFLIERRHDKPERGRLTGGVIPDDEDGKGANENAPVAFLQGFAAPRYLYAFERRLVARCNVEHLDLLAKVHAAAKEHGGILYEHSWLHLDVEQALARSSNTEVRHARASDQHAPSVGPSHENP